ncbi:hypothetical protein [Flavobacterium sp.]|uniref:hypothetical protein n=1 Tax=Flavobacterium sp. TaxID=239 RepID=UPI0026375E07|nr:hypothetical protein [Flavobacterium sp.]
MKKSVLNLAGAKQLTKDEQKTVTGGGGKIKYIAPPQGTPSELGCNANTGLHPSCYIQTANGCFIALECLNG